MSRRTHDAVLRLLLATAVAAPAAAQPWGGEGCTPAADLRALVDAALAASPSGPFFGDGRGSGAPGYSAAVVSDDCGVFAYAAGDRWLTPRRPMQTATRHHLGSLTKPVTAALTMMLADEGAFGPEGGAGLTTFPGGQLVPDDLFGLYALVDLNGHLALDAYDVEPFVLTNGGGGAGALTAAPRDYARFFHALLRGGLLSGGAQQLLEDGFLAVDGTVFSHGFGLFRVPSAGLGTLITKGGATIGSNCFAAHSLESEAGSGITAVVCRNSADLFLPNPGAGAPNSSISVADVVEDLLATTGGL